MVLLSRKVEGGRRGWQRMEGLKNRRENVKEEDAKKIEEAGRRKEEEEKVEWGTT